MDMLLDKAHLALNDGTMFGAQGDGFARLNAGTPRAVLAMPSKASKQPCAPCANNHNGLQDNTPRRNS